MPFDLLAFEAEAALQLIPTDKLPATALEAVEAGLDGPNVLRMAVLDPNSPWEIEQALPAMLAELGCKPLDRGEAALTLARLRAEQIIRFNDDPLLQWSYFHSLYVAADYPVEISGLAYALDECDYLEIDIDEQRRMASDAIQEFLSPALREQRKAERQEASAQLQETAHNDWPFRFNSPTRHAILRDRLNQRARDAKPFAILLPLSWLLCAWGLGSWKYILFGMATVPVIAVLAYWAEYRRMKRERRDILLRNNFPEDQI